MKYSHTWPRADGYYWVRGNGVAPQPGLVTRLSCILIGSRLIRAEDHGRMQLEFCAMSVPDDRQGDLFDEPPPLPRGDRDAV